jgi:hypothetical protein
LPLLEQARLVPTSVWAFWEMLAEDTPPDGPRLPSLTRLILFNVTVIRSYRLVNMLIKRVEQGIPLECIDFYTCVTTKLTIQSLAEIMVEIQEPLCAPLSENEVFNWYEGICYGNEVEFDDRQGPWFCAIENNVDKDGDGDNSVDEDGDGDGGDDGDEDEDKYEMVYEMG